MIVHTKRTHTHQDCRRCGSHSYNMKKKYCVYCSFGKSSKLATRLK